MALAYVAKPEYMRISGEGPGINVRFDDLLYDAELADSLEREVAELRAENEELRRVHRICEGSRSVLMLEAESLRGELARMSVAAQYRNTCACSMCCEELGI